MDKDPGCRSFSWKVLRQATLAVGATSYIRNTALTAPPFFDNAIRGGTILWGARALGPRVLKWTGFSRETRLPLSQHFSTATTGSFLFLRVRRNQKQVLFSLRALLKFCHKRKDLQEEEMVAVGGRQASRIWQESGGLDQQQTRHP